MDNESRELLEGLGFTGKDNYLTAPIAEDDLENTINYLKPHHFTPAFGYYRGVFIAAPLEGSENQFWYVTSNIRGNFRGYRCRTITHDYDTSNIFASGKTCLEAVTKWVHNYTNRIYNRS